MQIEVLQDAGQSLKNPVQQGIIVPVHFREKYQSTASERVNVNETLVIVHVDLRNA